MTYDYHTTGRVVCFGEILLRLSAPAGEMPMQSPGFDVCIGGAEANVAVSLARFGHDVSMVGALPDNALGHAARDGLRMHGVDTRGIRFHAGRMGLYFLTPGAVLRPSEIIYDRAASAFAEADPARYGWSALFAGAAWLHVSGVTPAVSERAAQAALAAVRTARSLGMRVAFDGNYRASLWGMRGSDGADVLFELLNNADLAFADQRDIALVLKRPELAQGDRAVAMQAAFAAFPQLERIAATVRTQHSVDRHDLSATLFTRDGVITARTYQLQDIVDRIGTGDAFAAGVLHGLHSGWNDADALEFGVAAAVLKHSISGDFNLASEAQVQAICKGSLDVRR
jgi:2-dehydro-3-deoxygluconokinase